MCLEGRQVSHGTHCTRVGRSAGAWCDINSAHSMVCVPLWMRTCVHARPRCRNGRRPGGHAATVRWRWCHGPRDPGHYHRIVNHSWHTYAACLASSRGMRAMKRGNGVWCHLLAPIVLLSCSSGDGPIRSDALVTGSTGSQAAVPPPLAGVSAGPIRGFQAGSDTPAPEPFIIARGPRLPDLDRMDVIVMREPFAQPLRIDMNRCLVCTWETRNPGSTGCPGQRALES
jgi:hypothetical protein